MTLIISILVLLFSVFSMSPYMLAYRIPIPKNDNQWTDISDLRLTANQGATNKPVKEATYQKKAKILYLNNLLSERQLYGQWREAHMGQNDNSGGQQGYANMRYAADYQSYQESFDIVLCSYNGLYSNTNYTCLTFSEFVPFITDGMFNEQEMTLSFNDVTVHKSEGVVNSINNLGSDCVVNSSIYFLDHESDEPLKPTFNFKVDREKFAVRFRVRSEQCGIDIVTSKMTVEDALAVDQAMPYTITMTTFAVVQCILCFGFTKALEKKKLISQKISQGTIRIISSFDLYLAMESLLQLTTNLTLGLIAIPYAILAIYFETKLMRTIITTQGNLMDRGFKRLHIINAFCLIISVFVAVLSAFFQHPEWMFWLFAFHMIPQIFQNFTTQRKYRFKYSLILLFVIPKIVYILYVLAFPRNLFRFSPNYQLLSILGGIFGAQVLLLVVQNKYPVFFVKKGDQYQFFEVPENGKEVCSICLEELDSPSPTKTGLDDSLMSDSTTETDPKTPKEPVKQQTEKMTMVVTPCKHQFHECCLRDWARLKSVCPYCRSELPPLPEQDDE